MVDPRLYGSGDSYPTKLSDYDYRRWTSKPVKSIFLRKYSKYPWKKGTRVKHTVDNRIKKITHGYKTEVFHPPK